MTKAEYAGLGVLYLWWRNNNFKRELAEAIDRNHTISDDTAAKLRSWPWHVSADDVAKLRNIEASQADTYKTYVLRLNPDYTVPLVIAGWLVFTDR